MTSKHTSIVTTLLAASVSLAFTSAWAQTSPPRPDTSGANAPDTNASKKKTTTLTTVVVTGGSLEFERTVADSLAPIDVLTPKDLASTGAPNLALALRTLLPSFNMPSASANDATDASLPAQLRGLPPDETLVLVNGKRYHNTAILNLNGGIGGGTSPVDLSSIPINAIDHIEVLRDGAAALYGSDAIAGVINIILKSGAEHGSASVSHGIWDGGMGSTWQGGADGGFALGKKGWVRLSVDALHQEPTNHAGPDFRYPGDPSYGKVNMREGLPLVRSKQATINLQYDLSPQAEIYAYSIFNKKNVSAGELFRALPTYEDTTPAAAAVYPAGFEPFENSTLLDDSEVLGLRGTVADWHYDISANTSGNHWKMNTSNTFNYSLGAESPTEFYIGTSVYREDVGTADFVRNFRTDWLKYPLTVDWGLEYRREEFTMKAGDPAGYFGQGAQAFPSFRPSDAGSHARHNTAAYVNLSTDLTDKLSASVGARHERYSDFGSTTSSKVAGRYAFTDAWALRGTVSTGFRAPSLQQQFYSATAILFTSDPVTNELLPFSIRTFPVTDPAGIALGAQPLKPEKSHNYSLGLVFTPSNGLYATLDLYQIKVSDRILLSGNLISDATLAYLTSVGFPGVQGGRFFTNAIDTRTRGADLVVTYPVDLGNGGSLNLTGGANYNKTDILSIAPNPPQLGLAGLVLPVVTRSVQGGLTRPSTKAFIGAQWDIGNWAVHGQLTRYGEIQSIGSVPESDQTFGARYVLDLSGSYNWEQWTFTLGANNATNTYPEKNSQVNNYHGIIIYPQGPFGFNGAYYYASVGLHW